MFICSVCNYQTERNYNFQKHLLTKKHKKNILKKKGIIDRKNENFKCKYCNKNFKWNSNKLKHEKYNCKVRKNDIDNSDINKRMMLFVEQGNKNVVDILNKMEGNTYIQNNIQNNQNNIIINDYGNENMDMLTNKFLTKMLNFPMSSIPRMVKKIHFNDKYPENKNLRVINKKDNKLQVIKNGKWHYVDKKNTFRTLIDTKNEKLEDFYNENKEILNKINRIRFENFQNKLADDEKKVWDILLKDLEIIFWNSM